MKAPCCPLATRFLLAAFGLIALTGFGVVQLERVDPDVAVPSVSVSELASAIEEARTAVLDVRLAEDFSTDPVLIPGASRRDPHAIETWPKTLPRERPVVVYCVKGRWVSQSITKRLEALGFDVSQLDGGIEAWKAAGKPTTPAE